MTARAPVYIDSGKLHVFEDGDTLPPWLSPSSMAWENLTGVPAGITQLAALTGPGYAKVDAAGAWSVQAAIPQADVSGLTTALAGLQPLSARLTSIAGLTDAAGWLHDDGSGAWSISVPTKSDVGLSLVENTALSTWGGSANLATLGTVTTGVWHGTAIADAYISSAAAWNAKEGGLGNPSASGQVLASTTAGVRSWVSLPVASTTTPAALGTAAVGTGTTWARADHVHAMPTASQVGAEPALGSPGTSSYLLSSTSTGTRSWVAPYSLPTATASVLGGVKVGTGLAIASSVLSVAYGTTAGTACVGNDSRLSNSRTPTAHALDGALHTISGKTAGQVLVATGATTFGFATISGDAALSGAGALTLATLLTAGSAGSATTVPTLTWDAKGRLTAVGSAAISIPHTQISDWATATSSFLTANQSISLTGAVTGSGTASIATSFSNTHLASIDQDLTTTSSPTFANNIIAQNSISYGSTGENGRFTIHNPSGSGSVDVSNAFDVYLRGYRPTGYAAVGILGVTTRTGSGTADVDVLQWTPTGVGITGILNVTGLITANGGVSGNLTGHASLDIPLTGGKMADNSGIRVEGAQSGGFVTQYKNTSYPNDLRLAGISSGYFNFGYNSSLFSSLSFIGTSYSDGYVKLDGPGTSGNLMANKFILAGGSAAQFLKADGSVDNNVYLPLSGTASNASALGGVASDYYVRGTGFDGNSTYGKRTTCFSYNASTASTTCLTGPLSSGFYDGAFVAGQTPNNSWAFVINTSHSNNNTTSKFQFQLAAGFGNKHNATQWGAENYWVRVINPHGVGDWCTLIHSGNYPSFNNFTSGIVAGNAGMNTWAGGAYSWFGSSDLNNSTTWSGFMQTPGETLIGALSGGSISLAVAQTRVLTISGSLVSTTLPLTVAGLITANGGISGNLTGHASLDIPLTGSVALTGSIQTTQGLYAASGLVGMYSMYDNIFTIGNNARNIQVNNTTGETNFKGLTSVSMPGSLTVSGSFTPAVNIQSAASYTITSSDQGKMILSNGQLSLPEYGIPTGFWCLVNWHVGGGGAVFGPTTSGTTWILRGQYVHVSTSTPFTGVVSWDGYTWYAG